MTKQPHKVNSKDVILTDIYLKTNKKILYSKKKDVLSTINLEMHDMPPWNILHHVHTLLKDIFLPKGYPESVSSDYLEYQIWDSCQAFCSSISGTLTLRAVMEGIGVGSETATPVSATMTWIFKDGMGMLGSIAFAWVKGSRFDSDCKKWRLFADILNNVAMLIEMYIPTMVQFSMHLLCISTLFKALVGTAGGSTRASVVTHQAIKGNTADVSAKDSSQEIFINLWAFLAGIFILRNVTEADKVWAVLWTAIFFHLLFNYKAVKSLKFNAFNNERFRLSLRTYLPTSIIPTVEQVNEKESVFMFSGLSDFNICGFSIKFGAAMTNAIKSQNLTGLQLLTLVTLFQDKKYFILSHMKSRVIYVTLRKSYNDADVLKAYFHAVLIGLCISCMTGNESLKILERGRKNSPIQRMKAILQESSFSATGSTLVFHEGTTMLKAYMTCEEFIHQEFVIFCQHARELDWTVKKQMINVGDWRGEWMQSEELKEDVIPRRSAMRAFGHGKQARTPKRKSYSKMFVI